MAVASGHKVRLSVNLEKQKKKFSAVFLYMVVSKLYTNPQINLYFSVSVVHMELQ